MSGKHDREFVGLCGKQGIELGIVQRCDSAAGVPNSSHGNRKVATSLLQFRHGNVGSFLNRQSFTWLDQYRIKVLQQHGERGREWILSIVKNLVQNRCRPRHQLRWNEEEERQHEKRLDSSPHRKWLVH